LRHILEFPPIYLPLWSYRFLFKKRNLHFPYVFAVMNKLDKRSKAATNVKNTSSKQKNVESHNNWNFLIAVGGGI